MSPVISRFTGARGPDVGVNFKDHDLEGIPTGMDLNVGGKHGDASAVRECLRICVWLQMAYVSWCEMI